MSMSKVIEFPIHDFMGIEPRNKTQQKQLENNRIRLGIKNKEEDFVLKCILSFDWKRQVILREIEKIEFNGSMVLFRVMVTAPSHTVDYCCSNPFKEEGWSFQEKENTFSARAWYTYHTLNRYITR